MKGIWLTIVCVVAVFSAQANGPVLHLPSLQQKSLAMSESSAYPNPFQENTTIYYNPIQGGKVAIKLYTGNGKLLGELFNDVVETGQYYQFELNGKDLIPGVYYYTVESKSGIFHQRLDLVR